MVRKTIKRMAFERFFVDFIYTIKNKREINSLLFFMVETAELESATPCMSSKYSNQLSYASIFSLT